MREAIDDALDHLEMSVFAGHPDDWFLIANELGSPGGELTLPSEASPPRFPAPVHPFVRRRGRFS